MPPRMSHDESTDDRQEAWTRSTQGVQICLIEKSSKFLGFSVEAFGEFQTNWKNQSEFAEELFLNESGGRSRLASSVSPIEVFVDFLLT